MRSNSQSGAARIPEVTPRKNSSALLHELARCLEGGQQALLSKDLHRIQEFTAKQRLLLESICVLKINGDNDERAEAARVLQLGRTQLAILRRWQQTLRVISNFHAGIQSSYEAELGIHGVVVRQQAAFREG